MIQIERQNLKDAITELNLVLAQSPEHSQARYYLASLYAAIGRKEEALDEMLKVEEPVELFVKARTFAAFMLRQDGRLKEARDLLGEALEQDPNNDKLASNLVLILRQLKEFDRAEDVLVDALEKLPNDESLLFQYAVVQHELGDEADSIATMEKVLKISPENSDALNYVAYGLAESGGDLNRALQLVNQALKLKPKDGFYLDTLGWIYMKQNKFAEAEQVLLQAVNLSGQDPVIIEHYADSLVKLGKITEALPFYEKALAKAEQSEDAKLDDAKMIERLKAKIQALEPAVTK